MKYGIPKSVKRIINEETEVFFKDIEVLVKKSPYLMRQNYLVQWWII